MNKPKNQNRTFHLLQKADILTCYNIGQNAEHGRRFQILKLLTCSSRVDTLLTT